MDVARGVVLGVAGTVVLLTLATGPFGFIQIPAEGFEGGSPGDGNATVTVVGTPAQPSFDPGRQGGNVYYLRVPDIEIDVSKLTGNPILVYSIDVPGLNYSRSSVHFLGSVGTGRTAISLKRDTFQAADIERETYRGRIKLILRTDEAEHVVYNETTTIEVTE